MSVLALAVSALSLRSLWSLLDRLPPGRRRRRGGSGRQRASSVRSRVETYTTAGTLRLAASFSSSLRPGDVLGGAEILRQRAARNRSTVPGCCGGVTGDRGASGAPPAAAGFISEGMRVLEERGYLSENQRRALASDSEQALARRVAWRR